MFGKIRPLIFKFDPETAHNLAIHVTGHTNLIHPGRVQFHATTEKLDNTIKPVITGVLQHQISAIMIPLLIICPNQRPKRLLHKVFGLSALLDGPTTCWQREDGCKLQTLLVNGYICDLCPNIADLIRAVVHISVNSMELVKINFTLTIHIKQ